MRSWLSVLITDAESKKGSDIPIAPSLYSLSNKMDNSLLAVRDINHKYIVVESREKTVIPAELLWSVIAVTANSGYDANTGEELEDGADRELPGIVTFW